MSLSIKFSSVLLGSVILAAGGLAMAQSTISATESISSFRELNKSFLSLYRLQNPQIDANLPLIVIIRSESISAIEASKSTTPTTTYTLAPQIEEIKSALHATLAFQGLMNVAATTPDDNVWTKVAQFHADVSQIEGMVERSDADIVTRSATLAALRELQKGIKAALGQKAVTKQQVVDTLHSARPHLMQAVNKIGEVSVEQMTVVFRTIKEKVSPEVWDKAVVVVPGPATARIDNMAVMAAMRVLGQEALGRRIFYSEGIYDDKGITAFVQLLMRDKRFSEMLFDDPYRMWRDLFADTSRQYINHDYFTSLAQHP